MKIVAVKKVAVRQASKLKSPTKLVVKVRSPSKVVFKKKATKKVATKAKAHKSQKKGAGRFAVKASRGDGTSSTGPRIKHGRR